ncbi:MAG TPA: hypothetical protein ENJ48_00495 [Anaerolineae bacterium]|nr:hypothetical protein [Anaerolineae bacterium]
MTAKSSTNQKVVNATVNILLNAAIKAGVGGGIAASLLLLVNQIAFSWLRTVLIPPAFITVWIVTGIAAAMFAGALVKTPRDGFHAGVLAGIVAGTVSGLVSMLMAAFGVTFKQVGAGVLTQFSDAQLASMAQSGITEQLLSAISMVIAALFVCGAGGIVVAALLGGVGGWLYPKFNK